MILLYVFVIPATVALVANQADALGAWIAVPIARWAARVRYVNDPDRAAERAEDWAAQIQQSIPGSLFKLGFALGLAGRGLAAAAARTSRQAASPHLIPSGADALAKASSSLGFCTRCGKPRRDRSKFCPNCGTAFAGYSTFAPMWLSSSRRV